MQKQAIEWDLSSIPIFNSQVIKIPVHEVKNAPCGGLGWVACAVNPVSRQ